MAVRLEELSKTIDQLLPDPDARPEELATICRRARELHVASVCVPSAHVAAAADELQGSDVKVCAVVGFPSGRARTQAKLSEARRALAEGAGELEFVLNVAALRAGDARFVRDELVSLVRMARLGSANGGRGTVLLKAIVGTASLDDRLKKLAAKIVELAEVDFAQTGTGYGAAGATIHDVGLLRECLPETVGVKACGAIDTFDDVVQMIDAGAGRIGSAAAIDILEPAAPLAAAR
jgi:deoxyribose-phosphate aldolase